MLLISVLPYMLRVLAGAVAAFDPRPVAELPSGSDGECFPFSCLHLGLRCSLDRD